MGNTLEGLKIELHEQMRQNSKLIDLLLMMKRTMTDTDGRIESMLRQANKTKQLLDDTEVELKKKLQRHS